MARRHEVFVTDEQWEKIKPFIPTRQRSSKGGRTPADDRACLEGILWVLRSGARWRDLPERYPSPSTCWRRLAERCW
jgi:transposase